MTTYGVMQARIANELARGDLTNEIKLAIQAAIDEHETTRFWFNQVRSLTFNTVSGQRTYGATALADISTMLRIDRLMQQQTASLIDLDRVTPEDMDLLHTPSTAPGRPQAWAWIEREIHLWPIPNAVFITRIFGIKKLTTLVNDNDTNDWMTEGEQVIRNTAKRILLAEVINDFGPRTEAAMRTADAARDRLLTETHMRMPKGRIVGTSF